MIKAPIGLQELRRRIYDKAKSEPTHHKRGIGWRRWSNAYLYDVLGLFWDWKVRHLPNAESYK
jgi:hypothetical protein